VHRIDEGSVWNWYPMRHTIRSSNHTSVETEAFVRRVTDKLTGLCFCNPSSLLAPTALDVCEQVDWLIVQATVNANLCCAAQDRVRIVNPFLKIIISASEIYRNYRFIRHNIGSWFEFYILRFQTSRTSSYTGLVQKHAEFCSCYINSDRRRTCYLVKHLAVNEPLNCAYHISQRCVFSSQRAWWQLYSKLVSHFTVVWVNQKRLLL
jgi:hypothetical protein